ncbi:MAG: large conductance mechanosensitive channel protein MscL [Lactobacillaceae bacterium]|jgi:large conductance mechanosensitive channel|nr:large conductance mechanosensitive channel protein MscL [Lactobacillaceae bacterium]
MKNFFSEFRDFIMRGNVMDLAVAFIMGAAFTTVVKSVVDDLMMPLIGIITNSISFTTIVWHIGPAQIKVGAFISALIVFIFTALAVFLMIKGMNAANRLHAKDTDEDTSSDTLVDTELSVLLEIRDQLAAQKEAPTQIKQPEE